MLTLILCDNVITLGNIIVNSDEFITLNGPIAYGERGITVERLGGFPNGRGSVFP